MVDVAEEVAGRGQGRDRPAARVEAQAKALGEERLDLFQVPSGLGAVVQQQDEVVHVADVVAHPQRLLDEVVERVEVEVGEHLAREAADRHPDCRRLRAVGDQRLEQPEQPAVADPPCQQPQEHPVVDASEIAGDVALEHVAFALAVAHEAAVALDGAVLAAGPDAGVGVGDEAALEDRVHYAHDRVVEHPVAEGGGADLAPLRVGDEKAPVRAPAVGARLDLAAGRKQARLEVELELAHGRPVALARARPQEGAVEVLEVDHPREQVLLAPHRRPRGTGGRGPGPAFGLPTRRAGVGLCLRARPSWSRRQEGGPVVRSAWAPSP